MIKVDYLSKYYFDFENGEYHRLWRVHDGNYAGMIAAILIPRTVQVSFADNEFNSVEFRRNTAHEVFMDVADPARAEYLIGQAVVVARAKDFQSYIEAASKPPNNRE